MSGIYPLKGIYEVQPPSHEGHEGARSERIFLQINADKIHADLRETKNNPGNFHHQGYT